MLLFTPGPWLAIDATNVEVRGTRTATLDQALDLVGHGQVASIVGRLRPEVVGVDIDSPVFADQILDTLTAFCTARGLWHLTRPSGGAPGRAHLFLIPGVHREDLDDLVLQLRAELGRKADPATGRRAVPLSRAHVDVRSQLRPLSAPHRCQPTPALDQLVLAAALDDLRDVLGHLPTRPVVDLDRSHRSGQRNRREPALTSPGTAASRTTAPDRGPHEARVPLPRPLRGLSPGWTAYVHEGRAAAAAAGLDREPGSRSTIEYDATRALILAGFDETAAWTAISAAHPTAFVKARANGRRWWWHVWNAAVDRADEWLTRRRTELTQHPASPTIASEGGDPSECDAGVDVAGALARAHTELEATWRSWPAQTRHTRRELMRCVLERMARRESTSVALPQRDVLLDCALESRNTIAAARDDLITAGLLDVRSTHVRGTTDTADTWSLPARFLTPAPPTEPDPEAGETVVGNIEPSRGTPPHADLPLRRTLGLPRTHLLEALATQTAAQPPSHLAHAAGLASLDLTGAAHLTRDQQRTVRGYLHALAGLGLATVDAEGTWTATPAARTIVSSRAGQPGRRAVHPGLADPDVQRLYQRGQDRQDAVRAAVTAERTEFRARLDPTARRHRWLAQRSDALARQAKVDAARRKAWWDGLDHTTRQQRQARAAAAFAALSPHEQAARKTELAIRRARAGLNERERHQGWWASLSSAERDQRCIDRTLAFHAHPEELRAEHVAAWTAHRARWGLPQRVRRDPERGVESSGLSPSVGLAVSRSAGEMDLVSVAMRDSA